MKSKFAAAALALFVAVIVSAPASAQVNVGDKPKLNVPLVGGGTLDLSKLKGRLVLIDFWATWCGPCMAEAPHMVDLNKKLGPKGLQIVGISLDRDTATMKRVAEEVGFTWPQHIDQGGKLSQQFGVNGIPHVYLLGPDGSVLWHGHPAAGMDKEIEKAFRTTPPKLVDEKLLAQGRELIGAAETSIGAGDTAAAIKALGKVPAAAKGDEDVAARYAAASKSLQSAAEKMLAAVEPQIEQKRYAEAVARLKELTAGLAGTPVAADAKRRLAEVLAMPEAKQAIAKAQRDGASGEALAVAEKLKAGKKHELAYPRFRAVARDFPGTDAATTAAAAVAAYERDADFVKRVMEKEAGTKAKGTLSMARAYAKNGRTEQARAKYQTIIDEFPGTTFAATAKEEADALPK